MQERTKLHHPQVLSLLLFSNFMNIVYFYYLILIVFFKIKEFRYLLVGAHDVESQDLLSAIPYCIDFIQKAVSDGGNVLVHWYYIITIIN